MVIDHVGVFLFPEVFALRVIGRLAFPLFALLLAYNLVVREVHPSVYLQRFILWAVVAQIPYTLAFGLRGSIMVTLLLGFLAVTLPGAYRALPALAAFVVPIDFGVWGVVLILAAAVWFRFPNGATLAGLLVSLAAINPLAVPFMVASWLALAVFYGVRLLDVDVRRLPWQFGWWFYPAHIAILWAVWRFAPFGS